MGRNAAIARGRYWSTGACWCRRLQELERYWSLLLEQYWCRTGAVLEQLEKHWSLLLKPAAGACCWSLLLVRKSPHAAGLVPQRMPPATTPKTSQHARVAS
jgi:hypothetical protein